MSKQGVPTQQEVQFDGATCFVWVGQVRGTSWRAYGDFRNRHIGKTGRHYRDALANWKRAGEYAADD